MRRLKRSQQSTAINNHGSVVVNQDTARVFDGFTFHQIPNPDNPARATNGLSINNRGAVVGSYNNATGQQALYYVEGVSYNLNIIVMNLPPGIRLVSANYINNKGQILARALSLPSGESPVFLLTPIPVGNQQQTGSRLLRPGITGLREVSLASSGQPVASSVSSRSFSLALVWRGTPAP